MLPVRTAAAFGSSWVRRCSRPFKLTLSLTERCNGRCLQCGIWREGAKEDLPLAVLEALFGSYPHFTWIDLTGGEIFLRNDLLQAVEIVVRRTRRLEFLHFPTNALCRDTLATIREIRRLFTGNLVITVSVDGPEALNDRIRGVPGSFRKATELLSGLAAARLPDTSVYAGMTLFPANADAVPQTCAALKAAVPGFDESRLHVNFAHAGPFYHTDQDDPAATCPAVDPAVLSSAAGLSPFALLERGYRRLYRTYRASGRCPVPCRSGEISLHVDCQARLRPCTMWGAAGLPLERYGYDLKKTLGTPEFARLLRTIRSGGCPHCFTPCEAYQTMLASPVRTLLRLPWSTGSRPS